MDLKHLIHIYLKCDLFAVCCMIIDGIQTDFEWNKDLHIKPLYYMLHCYNQVQYCCTLLSTVVRWWKLSLNLV